MIEENFIYWEIKKLTIFIKNKFQLLKIKVLNSESINLVLKIMVIQRINSSKSIFIKIFLFKKFRTLFFNYKKKMKFLLKFKWR